MTQDKVNGVTAVVLIQIHCDIFCDILQYTRMEKCNLFVSYNKNSDFLKEFQDMKKEKQVC